MAMNEVTREVYEHFFRSTKSTKLTNDAEKIVQVGKGVILWQSFLRKHGDDRNNYEMYLWKDGNQVDYKEILNGCFMTLESSLSVRIYCEDDQGKSWYIQLGDHWAYTEGTVNEQDLRVLPTREQIVRLFEGTPFTEILSECQQKYRQDMEDWTADQIRFATQARKALQQIYQINKDGGPGSRKKVNELIIPLYQEIFVQR